MWILATWGAIMPAKRKNCPTGDPRTMQVRVRRYKDAVYFREHYLTHTPDALSPIVTNAGTDYDARLYVRPTSLAQAVAAMAQDIDYTSFKDQTEIKHGDKQLHNAYFAVWRALYDRLSTRKAFSRPRGAKVVRPAQDTLPTRWPKRVQAHTPIVPLGSVSETWRMCNLSDKDLARLFKDEPSDEDLRDIDTEPVDDGGEWLDDGYAAEAPGPIKHEGGHLDHSKCTHLSTKTARRKCRRDWLKGRDK